MPEYRAYVLNSDVTVQQVTNYQYETDAEAVAMINTLYPRETVELWSGTRLIGMFKAAAIGRPSLNRLSLRVRHRLAPEPIEVREPQVLAP